MAAARHAYPREQPHDVTPPGRSPPATHPTRTLEEPDADDFYQVCSRRRWSWRSSRATRPVPPELVSLCFNCLANNHVKANCIFSARCLNGWCKGHRASTCPLLVRRGCCQHHRSPRQHRRSVAGCRDASRARRGGTNDDTTSARSASTGRTPLVPRCYAPSPTLPPLSPPRCEPPTASQSGTTGTFGSRMPLASSSSPVLQTYRRQRSC